MFRNVYDQVLFKLPKMDNQQSLMLCWRLLLWWGMEHVTRLLSYIDDYYFDNV